MIFKKCLILTSSILISFGLYAKINCNNIDKMSKLEVKKNINSIQCRNIITPCDRVSIKGCKDDACKDGDCKKALKCLCKKIPSSKVVLKKPPYTIPQIDLKKCTKLDDNIYDIKSSATCSSKICAMRVSCKDDVTKTEQIHYIYCKTKFDACQSVKDCNNDGSIEIVDAQVGTGKGQIIKQTGPSKIKDL